MMRASGKPRRNAALTKGLRESGSRPTSVKDESVSVSPLYCIRTGFSSLRITEPLETTFNIDGRLAGPLAELPPDNSLEGMAQHLGWPEIPNQVWAPEPQEIPMLDFTGSDFGDSAARRLDGFTKLVWLRASGTKITNQGLAELSKLPCLSVLELARTQVTDEGLVHLRQIPKLRSLDLSQTGVCGPGLEHIEAMPELRTLTLPDPSPGLPQLLRMATKFNVQIDGSPLLNKLCAAITRLSGSDRPR